MSNTIPVVWPDVAPNDDGIRPAGPSDACFYCRVKVGGLHAPDCVVVTKKVKIAYTYVVDVDVPYHWSPFDIDFHRNDSSWCSSNAFREIKVHIKEDGCPCNRFSAKFVEVVDDTPRRELKERK